MSNFITNILIVDFFLNFKVTELEHEFEPGDLVYGFTQKRLVLDVKPTRSTHCKESLGLPQWCW